VTLLDASRKISKQHNRDMPQTSAFELTYSCCYDGKKSAAGLAGKGLATVSDFTSNL